MRVQRLRIRTLMIAVAVAAAECWLLINLPIAGLLILGPLIGIAAMSLVTRDPVARHLGRGVAGGILQTVLVVGLAESHGFVRAIASGPRGEMYVFLLIVSVFAGFLVGLGVALTLRHANGLPGRSPGPGRLPAVTGHR